MADNSASNVKLFCPKCGQVYAAVSGQVRYCVCKDKCLLVPVKKPKELPK